VLCIESAVGFGQRFRVDLGTIEIGNTPLVTLGRPGERTLHACKTSNHRKPHRLHRTRGKRNGEHSVVAAFEQRT
jgi:hypothetical protein